MATDANTVAPVTDSTAQAAKPKTVIENMDSRRMFDTTTDALTYLNRCADEFADFGAHPQIIKGLIVEGEGESASANLDPTVYTSDMRVMVAVLANRGEKGKPSTVKAIVVTPAPKLDAILANESAKAWLAKIADKELNHVAVRALRTADDVESVADQMPLTLADYISSSRESTGGIMESFNSLFKGIIATLAAKSPAWAKRRLIKSELKKAFESRPYALATYPELEDRGDKPSLFVMALQLGQRQAKADGLAPDIFDKWLATRNDKAIGTTTEEDDAEDFELDDLAFVADSTDNKVEPTSGEATPTEAPAAQTPADAPANA